jgi:anhydro-N-acetylmuramic acid kinase
LPLVVASDERWSAELRIGMGSVLAERTGVTTLADFAARDVAADGRGGPLAALPDCLLFRHPHERRLLLHLGANSRIVYLPANAKPNEVRAVEAGPVATLLDAVMRQVTGGRDAYDPGGKHAVQGHCFEPIVQRWLEHAALQRRPPRVLSPSEFGDAFAAQAVQQVRELGGTPHDLLCTATHFAARCILRAVERYFAGTRWDRVLVSGGGVRNGLLWRLLDQQFTEPALERCDRIGIPVEGREATTAAVLAALTLDGVPGNLPGVTGASGSRLLGSFSPGAGPNWARCLAWMACQTPASAAA